MTLASDLLKQADRLTRLERKHPKQSSLRRSISSAYYSLFHLLIDDGSKLIISDPRFRPHVARAFSHAKMKEIADSIAKPLPPRGHWLSKFFDITPEDPTIEEELIEVCKAFSDLQELRHEADYDTSQTFTQTEAIAAVSRAFAAHEDWKKIRKTDNAKAFLLASAKLLTNR